jgi:hypothetical protein
MEIVDPAPPLVVRDAVVIAGACGRPPLKRLRLAPSSIPAGAGAELDPPGLVSEGLRSYQTKTPSPLDPGPVLGRRRGGLRAGDVWERASAQEGAPRAGLSPGLDLDEPAVAPTQRGSSDGGRRSSTR